MDAGKGPGLGFADPFGCVPSTLAASRTAAVGAEGNAGAPLRAAHAADRPLLFHKTIVALRRHRGELISARAAAVASEGTAGGAEGSACGRQAAFISQHNRGAAAPPK